MAHRRLCKASAFFSILVPLFVSISVVSCDIQFTEGTAIQEVFEDQLVNDDVSLHPTESSIVTIKLVPDTSVPETILGYEVVCYRTNSNTPYRTVEVDSSFEFELHDLPRASYRIVGRAISEDGVPVAVGEALIKVFSKGADAAIELKDVGHIMDHHDRKDATCTDSGNIEYWHCTRCGLDFTDEKGENYIADTTIPAKGHSLVHVEAKAPKCTEKGNVEHWLCDRCRLNFEDKEGSVKLEDVMVSALGHDLSTEWSRDEHRHWHICTRCSSTGDVADHAMVEKSRIDPTDEAEGSATYECDVCGYEHVEVLPALGHDCKLVESVPSTCTEHGYELYECIHEGCTYTYRKDLPLLKHSTTHEKAVAATCTENGNKEYWYCSICGFYYSNEACSERFESLEDTIVKTFGHTWSTVWSHDDSEHWKVCTICLATGEKLKHSYNEKNEAKDYLFSDATCESPAIYRYSCICGAKGTETFESTTDMAKGHELEHVTANAATCGVAGNKEYWKCTRANCGKLFSDAEGKNEISLDDVTIPATGEHVFSNSANPKGMFAVYDDYHVSICLVCDKEITDTKEVHTDGYRFNSSYHWRACAVCPKEWLETKAPHEYDIEGAGFHYCVCGEKEPDAPSSSGFEVSEDVSEPEGSIKAEKLGEGVWRFTIEDRNPGDSKKSIDTSRIRWFVDDSEVSDAFGSIVFNLKTTRLESYRVLCVFANDSGYGSEEAMVKGY